MDETSHVDLEARATELWIVANETYNAMHDAAETGRDDVEPLRAKYIEARIAYHLARAAADRAFAAYRASRSATV